MTLIYLAERYIYHNHVTVGGLCFCPSRIPDGRMPAAECGANLQCKKKLPFGYRERKFFEKEMVGISRKLIRMLDTVCSMAIVVISKDSIASQGLWPFGKGFFDLFRAVFTAGCCAGSRAKNDNFDETHSRTLRSRSN